MTTAPGADADLRVGDYQLLARLGEGGMGVVHLARSPRGERLALKVLRPQVVGDEEGRLRLQREVDSLERVQSRWVAEVIDADPWAPVPYIATRYVPGLCLLDHVDEEGVTGGDDLLWLAGCLAEGLDAVHAVGVLHRDVKPSNVLMEGRTPILIDFGLARVADDPRLTQTGWLIGTPGYLAPEILYGDDATEAADVFSWAATVAYAATGRGPFGRGPSAAVMDRVRRGEFDLARLDGSLWYDAPDVENLAPDVAQDLEQDICDLMAVVAACLDPEPARRPSLPQILAWLRPLTTAPSRFVPPPPVVLDERPGSTKLLQTEPVHGDRAWGARPAATLIDPNRADRADGADGADRAGWADGADEVSAEGEEWSDWQEVVAPPRVPVLERARRLVLKTTLAAAATAAVVAVPVLAASTLLVLTWLLRSCSIAASAVEAKRGVRGHKWYDGPRLLFGAPFDLVRALPSTLLLHLWSALAAAAGGLVCYAVAAGETTTLAVAGGIFVVSLWCGPGGSRVRSPLGRVVRPVASSASSWLVALLVLGSLGGWALLALADGPLWLPLTSSPF
ncbi:serine/threonine-protein kinase [Nocardioides acrostichi]|uniref:serine/threonine-protein kinase n=1 Tax=Nocardioides acrostichi TaxID=2784339 RepID=UPI001A9C8DAF|nr:serine/threonine-protein kinase [Nocardioides acrostichi]